MLFGRARIESRVTRRHPRYSTAEELPVKATNVKSRPTVSAPAYFLGRPNSVYLDRYATVRRNRPRAW
jgi:hypothetical protein